MRKPRISSSFNKPAKIWALLLGYLLSLGCNQPKIIPVEAAQVKILTAPNLSSTGLLKMDDLIKNVKYLVLDPSQKLSSISQLNFTEKQIIILDKEDGQILSYSLAGKFLYRIFCGNISNFNILPEGILFYNYNSATISLFDWKGIQKYKRKTGRLGLELHAVNNDENIFYLNGYSSPQIGSSNYRLAYYDGSYRFLGFMFRLTPAQLNNNYTSTSRFYANEKHLYFSPIFENKTYRLHRQDSKEFMSFDFGKNSLTDSVYSQIRNLDNFQDFPFVFDLSLIALTNKFSFFSFSFQSKEGYLVVDNQRHSIKKIGLGVFSEASTQFNNFIPLTAFKNTFVSVVDSKGSLKNLKTLNSYKSLHYINENNISPYQFSEKSHYTLMLYELRD